MKNYILLVKGNDSSYFQIYYYFLNAFYVFLFQLMLELIQIHSLNHDFLFINWVKINEMILIWYSNFSI